MTDEGSVGGSQTLAPVIYSHMQLGENGQEPRQALSAELDAKIQYFSPLLWNHFLGLKFQLVC